MTDPLISNDCLSAGFQPYENNFSKCLLFTSQPAVGIRKESEDMMPHFNGPPTPSDSFGR
jgi:hypothetical protein